MFHIHFFILGYARGYEIEGRDSVFKAKSFWDGCFVEHK